MAEDLSIPVTKIDGSRVAIEDLDATFDLWVHTGRQIKVEKCAPDSIVAIQKLRDPNVYPITRHIRGRVLLISNTGYQALRLLKDLFEQIQYKISIHTEKTSQQVRDIIRTEAVKEDNRYVDSFVVIIYGTPDDFDFAYIPEILNETNAPALCGKPKLIYVIGNDTIIQQVLKIKQSNNDPDYLLASTGFNGVMFYIYVLCMFVHELSAKDIWKLLSQFADRHRFAEASHCTLKKEFYFFPGLTSSVLPEEIQNMDPGDMDLYMKMLESSKMSTYNVRLMFVGLFGAGKTCTARRIMGKQINDVSSTDGIDVYIGKCKVDIRSDNWETLEDAKSNMPYTKLSRLLLTDEESESRVPDIKNLEYKVVEEEPVQLDQYWDDEEASTSAHASRCAIDNRVKNEPTKRRRTDDVEMASPQSNEPMDFEHVNVTSPSSTSTEMSSLSDFEMINSSTCNSEYMNTAYRVIRQTHETKGPKVKEAYVSLWDFAGQFVYYATHQLFFSPRSIYLLVLNMEDDLEKTLTEDWFVDLGGKESIEAKGGVRFWLKSIYTYAKGSQPGIPPIILVGTHKDKLPGNEAEKQAIAKDYFERITNSFKGTQLSYNIRKETFLLDNTGTDPAMTDLRNTIMKVSKTMPFWGEQVPAKWVELEQALEDRRIDGTTFIPMKELKKIDEGLAKPIADEKQLRLFLRFHHETGTLLYFDTALHLRDIIILDPQWIIHAFRCLISAEQFGRKYGNLEKAWRAFMDSGQLEIKLAVAIWEQDRLHNFYENHEKLLHFLEKLDIIARAKIIKEDGQTTEVLPFFYVPCLLKEPPHQHLLKIPQIKNCVSTPVLCYTFRDEFLPPAVFNRLIAICLGRWPVARQGKKNLIYCGCAVFMVSRDKNQDKHRMTLFFRKSKIGMRITRYSTKGAETVDPSICDTVRRVISFGLRKEFARFKQNTGSDEDPFIYQLQCKETEENDLLDEGLNNIDDLLENIDADHFCEQHSDKFHPHPLSVTNMLQEWFPDKIPKDFRENKPSSIELWIRQLPEHVKKETVSDVTLAKIPSAIGKNWTILMLDLGLEQVSIEQEQDNFPHNVLSQMYHCFLKWKKKMIDTGHVATTEDLISSIKRSEWSGLTVSWETVQNVIDGFN